MIAQVLAQVGSFVREERMDVHLIGGAAALTKGLLIASDVRRIVVTEVGLALVSITGTSVDLQVRRRNSTQTSLDSAAGGWTNLLTGLVVRTTAGVTILHDPIKPLIDLGREMFFTTGLGLRCGVLNLYVSPTATSAYDAYCWMKYLIYRDRD